MTTDTRVEPMTPNTKVENTIPLPGSNSSPSTTNMKRKAGEDHAHSEDKENGLVEKKTKVETSAPLVELKGRKLIFKQDVLTRNLPRRGLLNFQNYLLDEVEAKRTVTEIPEEFWSLIAMAGHELTSSNENLFIKHVKTALSVTTDDLPSEALTSLIPKLFTLKQYGLIPSDFSPSSSTVKIPSTLQIRCWEASDIQKHFPADQVETLITRRAERERAREECVRILDGLDDIEKLELMKGEKLDKEKVEKAPKEIKEKQVKGEKAEEVEDSPRISRRKDREGTANTVESRGRSTSPTKKSKMTPEEEEAARLKKEEREAKKAEIAEKKAAKDRERERKEAAVAKQKQTMLGFFKKPKAAVSPISRASPAGPSISSNARDSPASSSMSDYARAFRPLPHRPHVHIAQINRWRNRRVSEEHEEVFGAGAANAEEEVKDWSARDLLNDHLRKHGKRTRASRGHLPRGLKTMPPHGAIADVWNTLQDAEDPRTVLSELANRQKFPWKTLAFDQQTRPPYCGTFTKKSVVVGPRTPFKQDPVFDYSYDSSDDWQDDEGGEDVDDFGDGEAREDEEDEDEDEDDGEFDDFFDDSEDVEFTPAEGDVEAVGVLDQSRLPMKVVKKSREVPKKVVKLTPTWKGPVWESKIGEEGKDGLEGYRIQLLNDAPHSIDPFTFVSTEPVQHFKTSFSTAVIGTSLNVRCLLTAEAVSAPAEKPVIATPIPNSSSIDAKPCASSSTSTANGDGATSKPRAGPKVAFPSTHLEELYRAVEGSTKIRTDLVSQLREQFENVSSKAAIEQKIKEVASRKGKTKDSQWRVKPEAWLAAGLTPPTPEPTPAPVAAASAASAPPSKPSVTSFFQPIPPATVDTSTAPNLSVPGSTQEEPMVIDP